MGSLETLSNKYNKRNASVKRILQEVKELQGQGKDDPSAPLDIAAEALEENIFEWHFAIRGAKGSEFEGGIYHGRILLPPEYPFKPPDFVMLTPSGRFQVGKRICLSISQHHPEHWQPSWSVRTALMALIAFMPTPGEGALGSLDYTKEEKRELAAKSRVGHPSFGNEARREVSKRIHQRMLQNDNHKTVDAKRNVEEKEKEEERERDEVSLQTTTTSSLPEAEGERERGGAAGGGGSVSCPTPSRGVTQMQESTGLAGPRQTNTNTEQLPRQRQRGPMDILWSMVFWILLALATGSVVKNFAKDFLM